MPAGSPLVPVRQTSFAAGELAQTLWGRDDLAKYASGARTMLNIIATPHGAALNRPGMPVVGGVPGRSRIHPFLLADGCYVLEFGAGTIRYWLNDVLQANRNETPYTADDLRRLDFAQDGAVLTVTCPGRDPHELRYDAGAWTFAPVDFSAKEIPAGALPGEPVLLSSSVRRADDSRPAKEWEWGVTVTFADEKGDVYESKPFIVTRMWVDGATEWSDTAEYSAGDIVQHEGHTYLARINSTGAEPAPGGGAFSAWIEVSGVVVGSSERSYADVPALVCLYSDRPVTIDWSQLPNSLVLAPTVEVLGFSVYRRRNGVWGWVGDCGPEETQFKDDGKDPDWTTIPPKGENPFIVRDGSGAEVLRQHPEAVAYHEQRRVFAVGNRIVASRTGQRSNYDAKDFPVADDAVDFSLASREFEQVRGLVSLRALLAATNRSEWVVGRDEPLSAVGVPMVRAHSKRGSSTLKPLVVGNVVLFVQERGSRVRELVFDQASESYAGGDLTALASHLVDEHEIVDWAHAAAPYSIVWAVRDDGVLLSLTYEREQEVYAWSQHVTGARSDGTHDLVESVCVVPGSAEDTVYLVVARLVGGVWTRLLEKFASRRVTDVKEGVFLDSALTYRGEPAHEFSGLEHLEGRDVYALVDGAVVRGLTVQGGKVVLDENLYPQGASVVTVGLPYCADLELLDLPGGTGRSRVKAVAEVAVEYFGRLGGAVGQSFARKLEEWRPRKVEHGYGPIPLEAGTVKIPVSSEWNYGGRAVVRQSDPLPIAILSVSRLVEFGG